ncbi:MAG: DNA gyrase inhibitor YacG [Acidobacteriaceae bacterium]|nr:DNA gyrase inhibitor YacG [Acidobacteriaceae bacterium]
MATIVRCPICRKEVAQDDPGFPFCSDRCRLLDLGNWASEKYVISSPLRPEDLDDLRDLEPPKGSLQ